jgi:hypothetical protein
MACLKPLSDPDVTFTSFFWTKLFRLSGTKLAFNSAYNPESDIRTEVVNCTIKMYLRCFTSDRPHRWFQWLPWVEYCYNTSYHSSLKATPPLLKLLHSKWCTAALLPLCCFIVMD